tara:strand:- start:113 stop:721 length:609 start_codon:yes stop_codon:yes gene_type:complete
MVDECPTCEREFQKLDDYPLIYVASFDRSDIPADLKFPFYDWTVFVGPNSEAGNERPPEAVLDFFKGNKKAEEFEYQGWKWTKQGKWDRGSYHRENLDQREIIVASLNPYLDNLEGLVGKEVPRAELLPQFPKDGYFSYSFGIPDTAYQLMFSEEGKNPAGLRIAELHIMGEGPNLGSAGGPTIQSLAQVGKLGYEGRVRQK